MSDKENNVRKSREAIDNGKYTVEKLCEENADFRQFLEKTKEDERKFRLLYEQSPLAYQSLDKNGVIIEINKAWLEMLGYTRDEVIGKPFENFITPRSKNRFKKKFSEFLSSGHKGTVRFEMIRKDGNVLVIETGGTVGTDDKGNFRQTHCILRDITRQKNIEDRLRTLASIIDQCKEGIAVTDLEGHIIFMNRSFANMHGYTVNDMVGKHIAFLHNKEQLQHALDAFKQVQQVGDFKGTLWHFRNDGTVFPALMHNSILREKSGEAIGTIGTMLDMTELEQANSIIRKERDLAQKYLDVAGVLIMVIGRDKKVKMINKKGCEILGYSQQEILGTNWFEKFLAPEEENSIHSVFNGLLARDIIEKEYYQNDIITKSGVRKTILWHNTTLKNDSGNTTGTLSSGLDITEQKKAERQLLMQESLAVALSETSNLQTALELILETVSEIIGVDCGCIYLVDEKTKSLDLIVHKGCSDKFVRQVSHYDRDSEQSRLVFKGSPVYMMVNEPDNLLNQELFRSEKLTSLFIVPIKFKGEIIGCLYLASRTNKKISSTSLTAVEAFAAHISGVVARIKTEQALQKTHDELEIKVEERTAQLSRAYRELEAEIAERHLKEKMLYESEKLATAGRLAAGVAHEINNPLAGIKNSFLLLKDAVPRDYKYYNYVGLIEKEISRVGTVVQQMIQLYRPAQQETSELNLRMIVKEIVQLLKISIKEKHINFKIHIEDDCVINLSEGLFRQVLFNIIKNSIEASPDKSTITISADADIEKLNLRVSDQGTGIDTQDIQRIFEPFFTTKGHESSKGIGLGLPVSKSIIESMGGRIEVQSRLGKGSTFTIEIPLNKPELIEES